MYSFKFDVGLQLLHELNIDRESLRKIIDIIKSQDNSEDDVSYAGLYSHGINVGQAKQYMFNIENLLQNISKQEDKDHDFAFNNNLSPVQRQTQEIISPHHSIGKYTQESSRYKSKLKWEAVRSRCLQKAVRIDELLHPVQIVKTHQLCYEGLTLHRFLCNEYLVTASDDGFVKLWQITGYGLQLRGLLLCSAASSQVESLDVSSDKFTIAVQFYNHLAVWQLADFLFNPVHVYQPVFETQTTTKKYFQKRLISIPDVANNIYVVNSRFLIWESKSQILLVDLEEKKLIPIFQYMYPSSDQFMTIGWSSISEDKNKLLFSYSQDEMQYIGVVELSKVLDDIQYKNKFEDYSTTNHSQYTIFCKYQDHAPKGLPEAIKPVFSGEISSEHIYFIQIDFPEESRVNLENQMQPNFSRIEKDYFIFCYDNNSHFFILLISDIEALVEEERQKIREKQLSQQNKSNKKSQKKSPFDTRFDHIIATDRVQVVMMPYALCLAGIDLPADLSEFCAYSVEDVKVSLNNYACCQITVRNAIMHKQMTLFYDLNQIVSTKQYYYPINKIILNGFGGAGISNQLLKLQNELDIITFKNTVVHAKCLWIISDAYNINSIQEQQYENADSDAYMQLEASDQFIYVFNENGQELILAYRFPTDNYECDNQFSTIQCNDQGFITLSNNLGFLFLLGPMKLSIEYTLNYAREIQYTEQSFKYITPSSQFFLIELPGLSNFKFNRIKPQKKRKNNDIGESFTKQCFIDLFISNDSLLQNEDETNCFLEHLKVHEVPYQIDNKKITVLLCNQLLIIILTLYLRRNFPHLKNVEGLNVVQQTTRYFDRETNKYFPIQQFAQLPCYYQIIKQLFSNVDPTLIVNEKQQSAQLISKYNAIIIQQILQKHQKDVDLRYNYSLKEEKMYQTLKLPPDFVDRYQMVAIEALDELRQESTFRANTEQLDNKFKPICNSIEEFNLNDYAFINCNVSKLSPKYRPYGQLMLYVQAFSKVVAKVAETVFDKAYEIPHCADMGTILAPEKPKKAKQQKAVEVSTQTAQESYTEEYVAKGSYTSDESASSYDEYDTTDASGIEESPEYDEDYEGS